MFLKNEYFVEDGHHRILQKIANLDTEIADFSNMAIDATFIFHNHKPNYLTSKYCKYAKLKEWYEHYYQMK